MGFLDTILGGVISAGQQAWQNNFAKKEAEKNRQFQSDEAELNRLFQSDEAALQRDWSAQEAERVRDWNEEMYDKYNSLSGKIAQAEQAGVNPLFAVTGNAVTPAPSMSGSPSGASAGSVGNPSGATPTSAMVDLVGNILGFSKLKADIALTESETAKNKAETAGTLINNETLRDMNVSEILSRMSEVEMNDANVSLISSKILNTDADTKVKGAQLGQIASQISNIDADTAVKEKQVLVLMSEIVKNNKSLDVMDAQISEMASVAGLNKSKAGEIAQNIRNMVQQYGHNEVMNEFREIIASSSASSASIWDSSDDGPLARGILETLKFFKDLLSVSIK